MSRKKILSALVPGAIIIIALAVLLYSKYYHKEQTDNLKKENIPSYRCYPIMGTWAEVSLYGNKIIAEKAQDTIQNIFISVNEHCSRFSKDSELSRLNNTAFKKPFKCSNLLWEVLLESKYFYDLTDGSFDITITPLMKLWGFYRKQNSIPSKKEIKQALSIIGLNKVIFDKEKHTVSFTKKGITIDLGGIAKGYAVDLAYNAIKDSGIKAGVINLGGNIRTLNSPPPGRKSYYIGVRDPFDKDKIMNGTVAVLGRSLATSGDYEQFVIIDGKRFTHIINPLTGYPIKDMAADTIICKKAIWADALSTSVFLKSEKFAAKIHKQFPDIDILVVKGYKNKPKTIKIFKYGEIWDQIEEPLAKYHNL